MNLNYEWINNEEWVESTDIHCEVVFWVVCKVWKSFNLTDLFNAFYSVKGDLHYVFTSFFKIFHTFFPHETSYFLDEILKKWFVIYGIYSFQMHNILPKNKDIDILLNIMKLVPILILYGLFWKLQNNIILYKTPEYALLNM